MTLIEPLEEEKSGKSGAKKTAKGIPGEPNRLKGSKEASDRKTARVIRITEKNLEKYLGREKIQYEDANDEDQVGIVRGLAWTSVGGDTLEIEVNVMPGKGVLQLTGQMGDVMKESAQTALSYVRSVAENYGIKNSYFEKHDIHIHIPEGAVPKDGPSAGITMATAMMSAVTNRQDGHDRRGDAQGQGAPHRRAEGKAPGSQNGPYGEGACTRKEPAGCGGTL